MSMRQREVANRIRQRGIERHGASNVASTVRARAQKAEAEGRGSSRARVQAQASIKRATSGTSIQRQVVTSGPVLAPRVSPSTGLGSTGVAEIFPQTGLELPDPVLGTSEQVTQGLSNAALNFGGSVLNVPSAIGNFFTGQVQGFGQSPAARGRVGMATNLRQIPNEPSRPGKQLVNQTITVSDSLEAVVTRGGGLRNVPADTGRGGRFGSFLISDLSGGMGGRPQDNRGRGIPSINPRPVGGQPDVPTDTPGGGSGGTNTNIGIADSLAAVVTRGGGLGVTTDPTIPGGSGTTEQPAGRSFFVGLGESLGISDVPPGAAPFTPPPGGGSPDDDDEGRPSGQIPGAVGGNGLGLLLLLLALAYDEENKKKRRQN